MAPAQEYPASADKWLGIADVGNGRDAGQQLGGQRALATDPREGAGGGFNGMQMLWGSAAAGSTTSLLSVNQQAGAPR